MRVVYIKKLLFSAFLAYSTFALSSVPWHTRFPTVGLYLTNQSPSYPFLPHFFTLHQLAPKLGKSIKIVLIDTGLDEYHYKHMIQALTNSSISFNNLNDFICDTTDKSFLAYTDIPLSFKALQKASHATHMYSVITGKNGIAPDALCIVLKTFSSQGITTQKNLLEALTTATKLKPDIMLIGLKFHDSCDPESPLAQELNSRLNSFAYVIASAGNDGTTSHKLAYPARFTSTTFSIGAFSYKNNKCSIAPFSQAEQYVGPSFLLPGAHIEGALISNNYNFISYNFMSGTSCAAALYAGYLALVLAEFKEHFTQDQILKTLHSACIYPDADQSWRDFSLYGVPDMRFGLFLLHLLLAMRAFLPYFSTHFDYILHSCLKYLLHHTEPDHFLACSSTAALASSLPRFEQDFISYLTVSQSQFKLGIRHPYLAEFSRFSDCSYNQAVEYCASALIPHLQTHLAAFNSLHPERRQKQQEQK